MGQISLQIPVAGSPNSSEDPKVAANFSTLQTWANGNVDGTNASAAFAQSIGANQGGQTVKGATNIAASESRTNVAFGTLTTPDQVTGVVLPTNGLIVVWYQAMWQESVSNAARAAIFLGANQLKMQDAFVSIGPSTVAARTGAGSATNLNVPLFSGAAGLSSGNPDGSAGYAADVTTGQVIGFTGTNETSVNDGAARGGSAFTGGPCYIFAAAGTYTVGVQFKATSGSVTASGRKLWVQALSFS